MCIIAYVPRYLKISKKKLRSMHISNPDGFGIAWSSDFEIKWAKCAGQDCTINNIVQFIHDWEKDEYAGDCILHFRTASSMSISIDACHPHMINNSLCFMHNGNFFEYQSYFGKGRKDAKTDTQLFNENFLQKLKPDFLCDSEIMQKIEDYCKNNNSKMVFLDAEGNIKIINEQAGIWEDGIWYSNGGIDGYTGYGFSGVYEYKEGETRHKGGIITPMVFGKSNRYRWGRCRKCSGFFLNRDLFRGMCFDCENHEGLIKKIKI